MLISFEVENHRSIAEAQGFTFIARSERALREQVVVTDAPTTPRLTRLHGIFGDNAAGKSQVLAALQTLQSMVLHSMTVTDAAYEQWYAPFQAATWGDRPTRFKIDILIDSVRYAYEVAFDARQITFEQLLVYRGGKAQRWFHRERSEDGRVHWASFSAALRGQREVWRQATRERALFLTTAAQLNAIDLVPLTRWFQDRLTILRAPAAHLEPASRLIAEPAFKGRTLAAIRACATEIADVRVVWRDVLAGSRAPTLEVQFAYDRAGFDRTWMDSDHESDGRGHLFLLSAFALSALQERRCLCIDDFDQMLHPVTARHLVRLVGESPADGADAAQLLFTSRAPALLDTGLLRRDEMSLIERRANHGSRLRCLANDEPLRALHDPAAAYADGTIEAATSP